MLAGMAAVIALVTSCSPAGPGGGTPPPTISQPPPVGDPSSRVGSLQVGQAGYPVPEGALFVDAVRGRDSSSGDSKHPFRTIQGALDRAQNGQTVVVREGEYHETIYANTAVVIQNAPGEAVWLDGSREALEWTQDADGWSTPMPAVLDREIGPDNGDPYVSASHPAAAEPEMLFRDDTQLRQVLSRDALGEDSFMADRRRKRLYIGGSPQGHRWRTAALAQAIVVSSPDVTIRGIGIRRYGNSVRTQGAVYLARRGDLVEDVVIEDVATTGLTFYSEGNEGTGTARHVTVRRAGLMGIGGSQADHLRISGALVEEANSERFNATPNSAGIKVTSSRGVIIQDTTVRNSFDTTGIWLDESVVGFGVDRNRVVSNGITGISAELSSHGRIADNIVRDHEFGVVLYSSGDIDVLGNSISDNTGIDLDLRQDHRRQNDPRANGHDPRFPPGDTTNPWLVQNVRIRCNVLGPGPAQTRLRAVDLATGIPADHMGISVSGTTFVVGGGTTVAQWGTGDQQRTRDVAGPGDLPSATGERANVVASATSSPKPCNAHDGGSSN